MKRATFARWSISACLCVATLLAQYGPGMPGAPGAPGSPGTYTPPKKGYSSSKGIVIGAAAAAAVGIGYLVLHHHKNNTIVGCLQKPADGQMNLTDDNDHSNYLLVDHGPVRLTPGDRVALKGKKIKQSSDRTAFEVREVAQNYGPCR